MTIDMFPQTSDIWFKIHRYVPIWWYRSAGIVSCGVCCIDAKNIMGFIFKQRKIRSWR